MPDQEPTLKLKTARTLKWNTIDRVAAQLIYAAVGIVLANILSKEDFGLVGVLLIFQAFATLLTDGGFGMALIQKKGTSQTDYSSVFWFNLIVSLAIYGLLCLGAPVIADIFHDDRRLIPLSRWMFLSFVLNGLSLVHTNKLMKEMNVRMVAVSNLVALTVAGIAGIILALMGFGAWALVWQTIINAAVKSLILWSSGSWFPSFVFSLSSLRSILPVGSSVLLTQILNTISLYAPNFVIGTYDSLRSLGIYTQADKWSKMGSATITQILASSFIPLLSRCADDMDTRRRYIGRINRFTALILMPLLLGLTLVGQPLFHAFFGNKWDDAVVLFQILAFRGIFVVLIQLYYNYCVAAGRSKALYLIELAKDGLLIGVLLATVWFGSISLIVWGLLAGSVATYLIVLLITVRQTEYTVRSMLADMMPFVIIAVGACVAAYGAGTLIGCVADATAVSVIGRGWILLLSEIAVGLLVYVGLLKICHIPELSEMTGYLFGRFRRR